MPDTPGRPASEEESRPDLFPQARAAPLAEFPEPSHSGFGTGSSYCVSPPTVKVRPPKITAPSPPANSNLMPAKGAMGPVPKVTPPPRFSPMSVSLPEWSPGPPRYHAHDQWAMLIPPKAQGVTEVSSSGNR